MCILGFCLRWWKGKSVNNSKAFKLFSQINFFFLFCSPYLEQASEYFIAKRRKGSKICLIFFNSTEAAFLDEAVGYEFLQF